MTGRKRALILGCGYVGLALARKLVADGVDVVGTTRDPDRREEIEATGARAAIADVMDAQSLTAVSAEEPDVVYDMVRPQRDGDGQYTAEGTRNVVDAFAERDSLLIYLSSTSVYGRRDGEITDETTRTAPVSGVGYARVDAEEIYQNAGDQGARIRICRVPGIYGPGRTLRSRLESGAYRRIEDDGLWISRIHVVDLASALAAAWTDGRDGEIYLLCDDEPVTGDEYVRLTAELLRLPLPPTVERADIRAELNDDAFERRVSSRRCSNRRMKEDLGVVLRYPTVREGVPAALAAEGAL